ncbi:MAG: zf-HC2 domain-containing protein [Gemmatimonadota bacterium]
MNDCPNGDVRDLLPDLLHERLDDETRAAVEAHLVTCADCRAELALLGDLRATLGRTPAVDLAAIVAAVPAYRAPVRRSWVGWRTAAAITVIVAGSSSLALLQREPAAVDSLRVVASAPQSAVAPQTGAAPVVVPEPASPVPQPKASRHPVSVAASEATVPTRTPADAPQKVGRELAMGGGALNDLSDRELTSLLKDIENLDALPSADVEHVYVSPMGPKRP